MPRWNECVTEGDPLALGPGRLGEGIDALRRTAVKLDSDGVDRLGRQGDGGALGPSGHGFDRLESVLW